MPGLRGTLCRHGTARTRAIVIVIVIVIVINTPTQHGLAHYMADPAPHLNLSAFYQRKRELFRQGLQATRFKLLPCQGSYFQCVDISRRSLPALSTHRA